MTLITAAKPSRVYPRVGGGNGYGFGILGKGRGLSPRGRGNLMVLALKICSGGLSPRGRGKLSDTSSRRSWPRSIPAWAGETAAGSVAGALSGVYPRVGGGNRVLQRDKDAQKGLSPRGRGKLAGIPTGKEAKRSIPAWAGETGHRCNRRAAFQVYPRVGGGNGESPPAGWPDHGLSPRGRGKLPEGRGVFHVAGSIPAWAGETQRPRFCPSLPEVYPRVGGGNRCCPCCPSLRRGLSPRGRGKPSAGRPLPQHTRSIPAWAGETCQPLDLGNPPAVYPRVGGGNKDSGQPGKASGGLSPRGRGKLVVTGNGPLDRRSIPAWAGETHRRRPPQVSIGVYPRVGGGNPGSRRPAGQAAGLSPRGRGKPSRRLPAILSLRSIPALAGETASRPRLCRYAWVYPRVGGGNGQQDRGQLALGGLSPRGRGKPTRGIAKPTSLRSIPAWAGETGSRPLAETYPEVYPRVGGGNG